MLGLTYSLNHVKLYLKIAKEIQETKKWMESKYYPFQCSKKLLKLLRSVFFN